MNCSFPFTTPGGSEMDGLSSCGDNMTEELGGNERDEIYRHSRSVTLILIIAYTIICALGVIGNTLVVAVVLKSPRMRTVTNLFILNLAVADLLVILFCLPPTLVSNILVPWVLGWWLCKMVPYIQGVSVCASVYSLVAVSLDRCSAIWLPLGGGFTRRKARIIIFLIWVVACSLALPWALYFDLETPDPQHPETEFCLEKWPEGLDGDVYFLIGNMVLCYVFPLIVISICYLLIWIRVIHRNVPTDSVATLQKIHNKAKVGVLKMLIVVVLVFCFSWLPLYTLFYRIKMGKQQLTPWEEEFYVTAIPMAQWLGSSNSALNPIIYAALNVKFRRAFLYLLPNCCYHHKPCHHPTMTKSSFMNRNQTSVYNVTGV